MMAAPVKAIHVPRDIEPKAAPTFIDPKLVQNIQSFVEKLDDNCVKYALEAYWGYKDGILRKALETYAVYAVCLYGKHCRIPDLKLIFSTYPDITILF